jgi:hypothetical protein
MIHEVAIPFHAAVRGVAVIDPALPLEPLPPSPQAAPPPRPVELPPVEPPPAPPAQDRQAEEDRRAIAEVLDGLMEVGQELRAQQRQRLDEMQQVSVELAVTIASHLLQQSIEAGDYPIAKVVRQVTERLEAKQAVTVFLHPLDVTLLESNLGNHTLFDDGRSVSVVADASLNRGDCRAETGDMSLLSNLQEHLAGVRDMLLNSLAEAEIERRKPGEQNLRRFPDRRQIA